MAVVWMTWMMALSRRVLIKKLENTSLHYSVCSIQWYTEQAGAEPWNAALHGAVILSFQMH
jgi:hypothetical protein